jgi:phosphopantothenoylcysteine synthetase/decarboxylase
MPAKSMTVEVGNMEHRYSDRLTADLNIVIFKRNLLVAMGVVKNIGSEGVFIESGFDDLAVNQLLEIEFFSNEKPLKSRRFKAMVVHRNHVGFGAEIENIAEHVKVALRNSSLPDRYRTGSITAILPSSSTAIGSARL